MLSHEKVVKRLRDVRVALLTAPYIADFSIVHEQAIGEVGYFRIRGKFINNDEFLLMERFRWKNGTIVIEKYSFHWQNTDGILIRRWDNAPHHSELATFPHHLHEGDEKNVLPHLEADCFMILSMIEAKLGT